MEKRRKEALRQQWQREKAERRQQRQSEREERKRSGSDEDPDLIGIVPGPQPLVDADGVGIVPESEPPPESPTGDDAGPGEPKPS